MYSTTLLTTANQVVGFESTVCNLSMSVALLICVVLTAKKKIVYIFLSSRTSCRNIQAYFYLDFHMLSNFTYHDTTMYGHTVGIGK